MKRQDKILIVDDEYKARELLSIFVRKNLPEAIIEAVGHPYEALERMMKTNYDLLLLDYEMPHIDGYKMLLEIQKMKHIPQIMLVSAYEIFDFARKGIEIGVLEYIVKPINNEQIVCAIKKYESAIRKKQVQSVILPAYDGDYFVTPEEICFIEKIGRNKLLVQLANESKYYVSGSLLDWAKRLGDRYVYISRQCIINSDMVKIINNKAREIRIEAGDNYFTLQCSRKQMNLLIKSYKVDEQK